MRQCFYYEFQNEKQNYLISNLWKLHWTTEPNAILSQLVYVIGACRRKCYLVGHLFPENYEYKEQTENKEIVVAIKSLTQSQNVFLIDAKYESDARYS